MDRLGGRSGEFFGERGVRGEEEDDWDIEKSGVKARCIRVVGPSSSSHSPSNWDQKRVDGAGIWLGVCGRERGKAELGVCARGGGRAARDEERPALIERFEGAVDAEEFTGVQGREDAMELRETLRL
jgi:hypothetical protein